MMLAAVLGAVAMFLWSFVAHTLLPLGEAGIREIPREKEVTAALNDLIGDNPGTYIFPGPGVGPNASKEEKHKAMERIMADYAKHPSGLLVYHSPGSRQFNFPKFLTVEFAVELVESLLAVFLLAQTRHLSFGTRVFFVSLLGVAVALWTNVSYWNWHGFSKRYTGAYITTEVVGFILAGIVIALVLKNKPFTESR
jgi:hypothetical protein